jgi:hypothetical protein
MDADRKDKSCLDPRSSARIRGDSSVFFFSVISVFSVVNLSSESDPMRSFLDNLWALYELARLALITRCNFKGKYWTWRWHTAIGPDSSRISRAEKLRAMLHYGRWVARMRRG